MATEPFVFSLEPELLAVEADRDEVERRLREARLEVERADRRVCEAREELGKAAQRTSDARDDRLRRFEQPLTQTQMEILRERVDQARAAEQESESALDAALDEHRSRLHTERALELRVDELTAALRGLERRRQAEQARWRKAVDSRLQARIEEDALLAWQFRQGSEERT